MAASGRDPMTRVNDRRTASVHALRGAMLTCTGNPFVDGVEATRRYESDAIIVIDGGRIVDVGPARVVAARLPPEVRVERMPSRTLLVPGFVDCHVHYVQLPVIASHGTQLLDWLERHTFPAELAMGDAATARATAKAFFDETLACGTTTAVSFCTTHPASVDAFFAEAQARGVRAIGGKTLMDRHAPPALLDTPARAYDETKALIARWHRRDRLGYAITPRFAPTSTAAQLDVAGSLWREHPDCWVQSHVAENRREIAWVRKLFPRSRDYVDVYARFGLLGKRAIYGHGIHLSARELAALASTSTALAHCPTSNLFLGSGLFSWKRVAKVRAPMRIGLGSDVGGGTSLSMLATIADAYKVAQMGGVSLSPGHAFYLATRGGAHALDLDERIGTLAAGFDADLVLLDLQATPLLALRTRNAATLDDALFATFMLGDDRVVARTYAGGRCVHVRGN